MSEIPFSPEDVGPEEVADDVLVMTRSLLELSGYRDDEEHFVLADTPIVIDPGVMQASDLAQILHAYLDFDTSALVRRIRQTPMIGRMLGGAVRIAAQLLGRDSGLASLEYGSVNRQAVLVSIQESEQQINRNGDELGGLEPPSLD